MKDYYTPEELAHELKWSPKTIYQLARTDRLPIRYAPGKERGGVIIKDEFDEWLKSEGYTKGEK